MFVLSRATPAGDLRVLQNEVEVGYWNYSFCINLQIIVFLITYKVIKLNIDVTIFTLVGGGGGDGLSAVQLTRWLKNVNIVDGKKVKYKYKYKYKYNYA